MEMTVHAPRANALGLDGGASCHTRVKKVEATVKRRRKTSVGLGLVVPTVT